MSAAEAVLAVVCIAIAVGIFIPALMRSPAMVDARYRRRMERPGTADPGPIPTSPSEAGDPVLGYLFWHAPASPVDPSVYEEAIGRWHRALAAAPPAGFKGSWTWRLARPPWLEAWPGQVYLDVYTVAGFTALGVLNTSAPSGRLQASHDLVAGYAAQGSGALFAWRAGTAAGGADRRRTKIRWYDKPAGTSYPAVIAALAAQGGSVWLRQMVLGVGPELFVLEDEPEAPSMATAWVVDPTLLA